MKPIVKVDRVDSVEEAKTLQILGVDMITVSLDPDSRFNDHRYTSKDTAHQIRNSLRNSHLCYEIKSVDSCLSFVYDCKFDFVQWSKATPLDSESQEALRERGIGIIYSGIQASYDDDPSWILSSFQDRHDADDCFFQVDLLSDVDDAWKFLKEECPKYESEIQIEDINNLASQAPLLISTNFQSRNVEDILKCLPNIRGISFTLGENPARDDIHYTSYGGLAEILDVISRK